MVLSLQNCKLNRNNHESAEEWMGRFHTKITDCEYREYDRRLTEQFIHVLDDGVIIGEILRKLKALEDIIEATSDKIVMWAQRVEAQRVQKRY